MTARAVHDGLRKTGSRLVALARGHEDGQGIVEYALIVTLVSIAAMTALAAVGTHISDIFQLITDTL